MREAMQAGAHYVGGLDPTSVDGAMEKSLDTMFQIALDYDKGVDIHLHETTPAGVAAINYMVETVEKTPQLKGKLTISHAFALATLNEQQVDELAHRMAAPVLCWWTPPVPPRRWRVFRRERRRSIKGNWCGEVWQVDTHLKRLQR